MSESGSISQGRPSLVTQWRGRGMAFSMPNGAETTPLLLGESVELRMSRHVSATGHALALTSSTNATASFPRKDSLAVVELATARVADEIGATVSLGHFDRRRDAKLEALVRAMIDAALGDPRREDVLELLAVALCRSLAVATDAMTRRSGDAWLNPNALRRTLNLVDEHLDEELKVDRLATSSGLSPSAFLRAFRGSTGITPGAFVTARRTKRAEAMLRRTDIPVADIAKACGFGSAAHFSTTFKARLGLSPRVIRDRARSASMRSAPERMV